MKRLRHANIFRNAAGLLLLIPVLSCKLAKNTNTQVPESQTEWVPWVIKYERGPCFGECPVYMIMYRMGLNRDVVCQNGGNILME